MLKEEGLEGGMGTEARRREGEREAENETEKKTKNEKEGMG